MRARIVSTLPDLLALRVHWDRLLDASEGATPWQGMDFVANWWPHQGASHQLCVVVVERDAIPCMILPLQVSRWPWLRMIPVRILEPIGSLMDVNRPRLALGPWDPAAFNCALEALWARRGDWHTLRVDEKLEGDAEVAMLRQFAVSRHLLFRQGFSHLVPYLRLQGGWEDFLGQRSAKMRKNLRAARRRLEARGAVSLREYRTPEELQAGYAVVLQLNSRSWKGRARVEHGQSDAYRKFHLGWLLAMAARGRARILVLCCGEVPVAATVALMDDTTYYSAQIVHDQAYGDCSPGTLLESLELEGLMRQPRFVTYDMLGSFLANKLRWTDTSHWTTHVFMTRRMLRTWLFDLYYFRLKPRVRPRLLPLLRLVRRNRGAYEAAGTHE